MARFPNASHAGVCDERAVRRYDTAQFAAALLDCPRALRGVSIAGWHHQGAAGLCELASTSQRGAMWAGCIRFLDLDLMFVPALPKALAAALPHLRELGLRRYRNGGFGLEVISNCRGLAVLRLSSMYSGGLPEMRGLAHLTRLEVQECYNLQQLPGGLRSLQVNRAVSGRAGA